MKENVNLLFMNQLKFVFLLTSVYCLVACNQMDGYTEQKTAELQEVVKDADEDDVVTDETDVDELSGDPSDGEAINVIEELFQLKIRKDRVIVKTKSETDAEELCGNEVFLSAFNITGTVWVLASVDESKTSIDDLMKIPQVVDAAYGLEHEYGNGNLQYVTDRILMQIEKGKSPEDALAHTGLTNDIKDIELFDPYNEIYLITLNVKLDKILQICKDLVESGLCIFAEPDFFREMKHI